MSPDFAREPARFTVVEDTVSSTGTTALMTWHAKLIRPSNRSILEDFVARERHHDDTVEYVDEARGSYNLVLQFRLCSSST